MAKIIFPDANITDEVQEVAVSPATKTVVLDNQKFV
jgi:hypothetical protein